MADLNLVVNSTTPKSSRGGSWWAKIIAIVAVINLALVLFDLSYIPWRDLYLREFPSIVTSYDPFKGIEPHRATQKYLNTVDQLAQKLHELELPSPDVEPILEDLRNQSVNMIDENPFMGASKVGTFAKIKKRMRQHIGTESAKQAFNKFWSSDYLNTTGVYENITFFESKIRPLIQTNYFRDIDDNGHLVDKFWRIDIFFTIFFAIEFLIHTFLISLQQPKINWLEAMLRRWYDLLLLIPFWRWLRIIPVTLWLHQAGLVNLERVLANITYEPVAYLADRVSKFVMVRFINHAQDSIKQGEVARFLFKPREYVTINNINEQQVIIDRLVQLVIYKILPQVQPEIEAVLHHSIQAAFKQSNFYQNFQKLPVLGNMPVEATEQLAINLAQATVTVLKSSYTDTKVRSLFDRLTQDFNAALLRELQDDKTLTELQTLFSDWLEEMKLTYVQRSNALDSKATLAEVEKLHKEAKPNLA